MDVLSWQQVIIDGLILSGVLGSSILGSLYYNPRLWLSDYPKEMQAKVPPLSPVENRQRWIVGGLFLAVIIGGVYFSTAQLRAHNGGAFSFGTAWLNAFLVFNIFNLFDAVVIDWLILTLMKPKFMILPGTTIAEYAVFNDWRLHVGNYVKGVVIGAVFSLPIAFVATL